MSEWDLDEAARSAVFEQDIVPALFPDAPAAARPQLVLLGGAPGSGYSRATGRILADLDESAVVIRGSDLAAFHPHHAELAASRDPNSGRVLAEAASAWVRASIRFGREKRRSLILEGALRTPDVVAGTAATFAAQGYETRVVVVGARRSDALLTEVSTHLRAVRAGRGSTLVSARQFDEGFERQRQLLSAFSESVPVDRLTVLGPDGETASDHDSAERPAAAPGAARALAGIEAKRMSTIEAVAWLGEVKRVTTFAETIRDRDRALTEALIELHEAAIQQVIPGLAVNTKSSRGSEVLQIQERGSAARIIALRRSLDPGAAPDPAAPVVSAPAPSSGGPSR